MLQVDVSSIAVILKCPSEMQLCLNVEDDIQSWLYYFKYLCLLA